MLVADHIKLDAAIRKVATAKKVSLPAAPNAKQKAMQAKLTGASAACPTRCSSRVKSPGTLRRWRSA
jgi:hypothetical protein